MNKPILKLLAGKTNDILRLPSGKMATGFTTYSVTKVFIDDASNVKEFMIEQMALDPFKVS